MQVKELTEYEKRVLAATPGKALAFLRGVATSVEIRAVLFGAGYTQQEQELGWSLLHKATGYVPPLASPTDDAAARAAMAELDQWDEPGFRRISAALERLHPAQHEFVFAGLEAAQGVGAVVSVTTMLARLDQLEGAPERKATRAADKAAIATLTARGITPELRSNLRSLVGVATTAVTPEPPSDPAVHERDAALTELRAWYKDWSETARAVITRKDYLIRLGLSKRRSSRGTDVVEEVNDAEVPNPADDAVDTTTPAVKA